MKQNIKLFGFFVVVFLLGMAAMRMWDYKHKAVFPILPQAEEEDSLPEEDSLEVLDLTQATLAEGTTDPEQSSTPIEATQTQLADLSAHQIDRIISRAEEPDQEEVTIKPNSIVMLDDLRYNASSQTVAQAKQQAEIEASQSNLVMISAPVEPLLIKTLDEYKAFKQRARGSYPQTDFAKQQVLVLESTSNLPDKVFEIQGTEEKDGKLLVKYRVNMFGLDKKANTHSAVVIKKQALPLELKQVL